MVGILMSSLLGPTFLLTAPTVERGFHPRFLLSFPITLAVSVGVALIPIDGSTLGIVSIVLLSL
jgi:hypothetical protein